MTLTIQNVILFGSILLFISIITSKTSFRLGIPALIIFMIVGMLAGSDGPGGIQFDDLRATQFLGVIALTFILFSGGMDTKWESVRPVVWQGLSLSTLGVFVTAVSVGLFVSWLLDLPWIIGLLFGAIVSSTDAAAVFSILRTRKVGLKGNLRPLLELESGSNDPMAYFLTISLTSLAGNPDQPYGMLAISFFQQMIVGALAGYSLGKAMVWIVNKIMLDVEGLYPVLVMAMAFFTYSATDFVGGNGFLAIYLAGIIMGNADLIHKKSLMRFYDGLAWLMQIVMFLTLGLLVFPSQIPPVVGPGILIALFLTFVARPLSVFLSLALARDLNFRKKLFISWVGLRGAVPIVFATLPLTAGLPYASTIFHMVFFITLSSVLLQGYTLPLVARWLHLTVPQKIARRSALDWELNDSARSHMAEIDVREQSPAIGKTIVQLHLPREALIALIKREGKYETPKGATRIFAGDHLLVMTDSTETEAEVRKIFEGTAS